MCPLWHTFVAQLKKNENFNPYLWRLYNFYRSDKHISTNTLTTPYFKGISAILQCSFNVKFNQDLSDKKDGDYNNNLNNTKF